jgi:hypothetical protein
MAIANLLLFLFFEVVLNWFGKWAIIIQVNRTTRSVAGTTHFSGKTAHFS